MKPGPAPLEQSTRNSEPFQGERQIELHDVATAIADIARCIEAVDRNLIDDLLKRLMAERQDHVGAVPEMLFQCGLDHPAPLGLQVAVAGAYDAARKICFRHKVGEIELADLALEPRADLEILAGRPGQQPSRLGKEEGFGRADV